MGSWIHIMLSTKERQKSLASGSLVELGYYQGDIYWLKSLTTNPKKISFVTILLFLIIFFIGA